MNNILIARMCVSSTLRYEPPPLFGLDGYQHHEKTKELRVFSPLPLVALVLSSPLSLSRASLICKYLRVVHVHSLAECSPSSMGVPL
jgi:hypothetical protein